MAPLLSAKACIAHTAKMFVVRKCLRKLAFTGANELACGYKNIWPSDKISKAPQNNIQALLKSLSAVSSQLLLITNYSQNDVIYTRH